MAIFPPDIYPVADAWTEELSQPVEVVKTRNTMAAYQAGTRMRWRGSGEFELSGDLQKKFYDFLAETNNGLSPFGITTFLRHPYRYTAASPYVAQLSRHRYDAQPVTSGWHMGWENLIASSENIGDTTKWAAQGGATVTRAGGQTAPDGTATAWRIQTSGGSYQEKVRNASIGVSLPSGWRYYCRVWVRNLSANQVILMWTGFDNWAVIPGYSGWTMYSAIKQLPTSFYPGLSILAQSTGSTIDCLIWRPMIIAFEPDGSDIESVTKGDSYDYLPTPTGSYIMGDSNGRGYVWRESGANTSGVFVGRMFIDNAMLTSNSGVLSIQTKFIAPEWVSTNLTIEEV